MLGYQPPPPRADTPPPSRPPGSRQTPMGRPPPPPDQAPPGTEHAGRYGQRAGGTHPAEVHAKLCVVGNLGKTQFGPQINYGSRISLRGCQTYISTKFPETHESRKIWSGGGRHLDLPLQWIKPLWRHSLDGGTSLYFWQNFLEKISNLKEICLLDPSLDQDVSTAKNWKHMTLKRFRNMNMFRFQSHWFVSSTCANLKQNLGARGCDVLPSMTCYY